MISHYTMDSESLSKDKEEEEEEEVPGTSPDLLFTPCQAKGKHKKSKKSNQSAGSSDEGEREIANYEKYAKTMVGQQGSKRQAFNMLKFWQVDTPMLPILSKIAFDIMLVPAASTSVECVFSHCGVIVLNCWNWLSDNTVQALVCMKMWGLDGLDAVHKAIHVDVE